MRRRTSFGSTTETSALALSMKHGSTVDSQSLHYALYPEKGILKFSQIPRKAKINTDKILSLLNSYDKETNKLVSCHTICFENCQSTQIYQFIFNFLIKNEEKCRFINNIMINMITAETLIDICTNKNVNFLNALNCESMSQLKELVIIMEDFDKDNQLMGNLITKAGDTFLSLLSKCEKILKNSIEYLKFSNFFCFINSKAEVYLNEILLLSGMNNLKILDLRDMRLNAKQNQKIANALSLLVAPKLTKKSSKSRLSKHERKSSSLFIEKSMFSVNYRCSVEELYIGGNDEWDTNGIELLCNFIRFNGNLEILGFECVNSTLLNFRETTTMSLLILALNQHPSLYRLEFYHIKPFVLDALADQWHRRCKNIRISELYIQHIPEESPLGTRDNFVLPAVMKICTNTPWLQFLELKLKIYFSHNDIAQVSGILQGNFHLNGIIFDAPTNLTPNHKKMVANKLAKTVKTKDIGNESKTIVDAIYFVMCEAATMANASKDLALLILSFADVSFAHNAGILLLDTNILEKQLPIQDRKPLIEALLSNWKKLPFGGINYHDSRYLYQREKLHKLCDKINLVNKKNEQDDTKNDQ